MDHVIDSIKGHFDGYSSGLTGDPEKDKYLLEDMQVLVKAIRVIEKHYYGKPRTSLKPLQWFGTPYFRES